MADGNGNKVVVLNTRERVLSTDANRAQSFYGQGVAELLRFLLDASSEEDRLGGAYETLSTGSENPLRAYVVNGLRPQPVNGTDSLLISPGVMCVVDESAPTSDESRMAWVVDPGVAVVGTLTLPANGSGLTIIGVVECQRTNVVLEQDNRDVFNQSTGLFTPVLVNKVTTSQLVYRIRLGTPGAGFPGTAAGWTPLAVFNQPSAATTWDDVLLMWDVRNLVGDRWNSPFNTPLSVAQAVKGYAFTDVQVVGESRMYSQIDANYLQARAGGRIGLASPDVAAVGYFDLRAVANQTGNFAGFSNDSYWHVYAIFPHGLPRWQLYSPASATAPRRPVGVRGIPAITNVGPRFDGTPSGVISTPTATGLIDTPAQTAVVLASGKTSGAGVPLPVMEDGHVVWQGNDSGFTYTPASFNLNTSATWTLTDNLTHPGNARAVWVRVSANFSRGDQATGVYFAKGDCKVTGGDNVAATLYDCPGGPTQAIDLEGAFLNFSHSFVVRVPLGHNNFATSARVFSFTWYYDFVNAGTAGTGSEVLTVLGWEPGP